MKFLLENVQQAKLSGASAVAIKRLCVVCSPAMSAAHLPSLLQLVQSVDHIPLSNASINWLIEGLRPLPQTTSEHSYAGFPRVLRKQTNKHPFSGLFSRTTWVSRHQKG